MLIKAEQKFQRMSPRKLRAVAASIRGLKSPAAAIAQLEHVGKRAAGPLIKTIKQAQANAKNNLGVAEEGLKIQKLEIGEGPIYKRGRPVSRGRLHPIKKRTSHIKVILEAPASAAAGKQEKKGGKGGTKGKSGEL